MNIRLLAFLIILPALMAVVWLWERGARSTAPDPRDSRSTSTSRWNGPVPGARETKTGRDRSPKDPTIPREPDPEILALFNSAEAEASFYRDADQGQTYEREGFTNFFGLVRGALEGDGGDLAAIFNSPETDGAASEGFDATMRTLIEQLGDRYFAHHLAKQPMEVRKRILRSIWGRGGFPGERVDGIPLAGNKHYPFAGRLLLEVFPELEE